MKLAEGAGRGFFRRGTRTATLATGGIVALLSVLPVVLHAQPEVIVLDHAQDFEIKQRSPVLFPHESHMIDFSCLDCHHQWEDGENVLDEGELYEGNPSARCAFCHHAEAKTVGLRKAFHRQCMTCHRAYRLSGEKSGPRLCAECHPKDGAKPLQP